MYDYLAYANTTYFNNLIERFAIRINPINTNSLKVGVAAAIILF